jgi:hypothetical protein
MKKQTYWKNFFIISGIYYFVAELFFIFLSGMESVVAAFFLSFLNFLALWLLSR